jgi:peroxiredoxin
VCTDTPRQIRRGKSLHNLHAVILSDPKLKLIDRFGLRNENFTVRPPWVPGLPVPTTLLVDAGGIVRWIDQSADYTRRSDPRHIRAALQTSFA